MKFSTLSQPFWTQKNKEIMRGIMIAFLATDSSLLSCPATDVRGDGRINSHALTEDLLQVGELRHAVIAGPGLQAGELPVYLCLELLLDPGVGGQQE